MTPTAFKDDELEANRAVIFLVWKKQLLRKIKLADISVKGLLLLPFFIPTLVIWSFVILLPYTKSPPPPIPLWAILIFCILFPLFFLLLPSPRIFVEFGKIAWSQTQKSLRDIDWSAEKYKEIARAIIESGIDISKIVGKLEFSDRWDVHIYHRSRIFRKAGLLMISFWFFFQIFRVTPNLVKFSFLVLVALPLATFIIISISRDILFPRLTLLITKSVILKLKGKPTELRLLISHELSHAKHYDPIKKLVWITYRRFAQVFLVIVGIYVLIGFQENPQLPIWGLLILPSLAGWIVSIHRIKKNISLFQEIRADVEAIKFPTDYDVYLQLLEGIPIESNQVSLLDITGWRKRFSAAFKNGIANKKIEMSREEMENRIDTLYEGNISVNKDGKLRRILFLGYASACLSLIILLVFIRQAVMLL